MGNHPFNLVVVLFWLATMTWLVVGKVLPPMRVGEPPSYSSILKESRDQPPVCWNIRLQDKTIGWAASRTVRRQDGITELRSRVYLNELPLEEIAPGWLGKVLKPVLQTFGEMDVDKKSLLTFDPLGRLVGFESKVRIGSIPDAIKVNGQIEGAVLTLNVTSGEFSYPLGCYLPPDALMTDELSPQARLPGLRVGQTWTVPLYSPFRPPHTPLEILQATVDSEDRITWDDKPVMSRVIVYRNDPGAGISDNEPRGRVWVRGDGVVLRQEINVFGSRLHFIRLPDRPAENIWRALGDDWSGPLSSKLGRQLTEQIRADLP